MLRWLLDRIRGTHTPPLASIGAGAYVSRSARLDWTQRGRLIRIGPGATISEQVIILTHDASQAKHIGGTYVAAVSIDSNAFIGAGAVILPGVTIGEGAIVGAGAIVTKDVPAMTVVAGNPAREIESVADFTRKRQAIKDALPKARAQDETDLTRYFIV